MFYLQIQFSQMKNNKSIIASSSVPGKTEKHTKESQPTEESLVFQNSLAFLAKNIKTTPLSPPSQEKLLSQKNLNESIQRRDFEGYQGQKGKLYFERNCNIILQEKQVQYIAAQTKKLCQNHNDLKYFCFLTNYLYRSCMNLQKRGIRIPDIEQRLEKQLNLLKEEHPAGTQLHFSEEMSFHPSFSIKPQKYIEIDISQCLSNQKPKGLQVAILNQVKKAERCLERFRNLLEPICLKHGFNFKHSLKVKSKDDLHAINRTMEKMLKQFFTKIDLKKECQTLSLDGLLEKEQRHRDLQILKILDNKRNTLPWTVKDLLRGKCYFKTVEALFCCKAEIFEALRCFNYQVICFKNRLQSTTSDLVLNFLIGDTICEIQLALDFPHLDYEFNHLLYELGRSQFMSILSTLKMINEKLTISFMKSEAENVCTSELLSSILNRFFGKDNPEDKEPI